MKLSAARDTKEQGGHYVLGFDLECQGGQWISTSGYIMDIPPVSWPGPKLERGEGPVKVEVKRD